MSCAHIPDLRLLARILHVRNITGFGKGQQTVERQTGIRCTAVLSISELSIPESPRMDAEERESTESGPLVLDSTSPMFVDGTSLS